MKIKLKNVIKQNKQKNAWITRCWRNYQLSFWKFYFFFLILFILEFYLWVCDNMMKNRQTSSHPSSGGSSSSSTSLPVPHQQSQPQQQQQNKGPGKLLPPPNKNDVKHWSTKLQETVVSIPPETGNNNSIIIKGGADTGHFCYLGEVRHDQVTYHSGKLRPDDLILEIQGQKVSGYTLRDVNIWLKQVSQNGAPVLMKTLRSGEWCVIVFLFHGGSTCYVSFCTLY